VVGGNMEIDLLSKEWLETKINELVVFAEALDKAETELRDNPKWSGVKTDLVNIVINGFNVAINGFSAMELI